MDFEKVIKEAELPLGEHGEIATIDRPFTFIMKDQNGKKAIGEVLHGKILGSRKLVDNRIALHTTIFNSISNKNLTLVFFGTDTDALKNKIVPSPGWYLEARDGREPQNAVYFAGKLFIL